MFAPSRAVPAIRQQVLPRRPKPIVVAAQFSALATFAVVGTVFLGLTIAAPVALPIVERARGSVAPGDIAAAARLGSMWFLFLAGAVASFGATLAIIKALLQHLGTEPRD